MIHCSLCDDTGEGPNPRGPNKFCSCIMGRRLIWAEINKVELEVEVERAALPYSFLEVMDWDKPYSEEHFKEILREGRLFVGSPDGLWVRAKPTPEIKLLGKELFREMSEEEEYVWGGLTRPAKDCFRVKPRK